MREKKRRRPPVSEPTSLGTRMFVEGSIWKGLKLRQRILRLQPACNSSVYLANSLAQLLETARGELERDREAAKASLAAASSILRSEIERCLGNDGGEYSLTMSGDEQGNRRGRDLLGLRRVMRLTRVERERRRRFHHSL
jgi:hypothetical protein